MESSDFALSWHECDDASAKTPSDTGDSDSDCLQCCDDEEALGPTPETSIRVALHPRSGCLFAIEGLGVGLAGKLKSFE